jgi:hypothetical protein
MAVSVGAMAKPLHAVGAFFTMSPDVAMLTFRKPTGQYVGPDGRICTHSDLAGMAPGAKTWQQLVVPPPAAH